MDRSEGSLVEGLIVHWTLEIHGDGVITMLDGVSVTTRVSTGAVTLAGWRNLTLAYCASTAAADRLTSVTWVGALNNR